MINRSKPFFPVLLAIIAFGYSSTETAIAQEKHFLWKVQGEQNTVYLLGSVHVLPESAYPLPEVFDQAYDDAEVYAMEAVIDDEAMMETQMLLMTHGMLENGQTLKEVLPEDLYEETQEKMEAAGLPFAMFATFKPWLVAMSLVQTDLSGEGYSFQKGVDVYYMEKANSDGKVVLGLESLGDQLAIFNELSLDEQIVFLRQTIDDMDAGEDQLAMLTTAWEEADIATMDSIMQENFGESEGLYDRLLLQRNRNWLSHLEGYLKSDKNHLVVVGAMHLVGKDGVITMLQERGYSVEQL